MTKARKMGLMLLLLGSGISAFSALLLQRTPHAGIVDFKIVYLGARCMIQHRDPYRESEYLRIFQQEGGIIPADPIEREKFQHAVMAVVYLPSALLFVAPFAVFGWAAAQTLWMILTVALFTIACCLIWSVAADSSPPLAAGLVAFMLANTEVLFAFGNAAGVAVSLCAIAVWCFFTERFEIAGVLCLAASLAIKPHDSAAIWLCLLIAGGTYRKRALQTLVVVLAMSVPAILWVSSVSPHWVQEIRSNLEIVSARGGVADPGPAGISNGTGGMIIDLQTVVSVFRDDPQIYNAVTVVVCALLFIVWLVAMLRGSNSPAKMWFALAALVPLSMLPVYHRPYDAKLLILAVPACVGLWAEGGLRRWLSFLTTGAAILLTSDVPATVLTILSRKLPMYPTSVSSQMLVVVLARPIPMVLLVMSGFYLWENVRRSTSPTT